MNGFHSELIRKNIEEKLSGESEFWMLAEYDERVVDY